MNRNGSLAVALFAVGAVFVVACMVGASEHNSAVVETSAQVPTYMAEDVARDQETGRGLARIYDAEAGVVCWRYVARGGSVGLSCLPVTQTALDY